MVQRAKSIFESGKLKYGKGRTREALQAWRRSLYLIRLAQRLGGLRFGAVLKRAESVYFMELFKATDGKVTEAHLNKVKIARTELKKPTSTGKAHSATGTQKGLGQPSFSVPQLIKRVKPAIVTIKALIGRRSGRTGSGFFVGPSGLIITNHHVVRGSRRIFIRKHDGKVHRVNQVVSNAKKHDLSLLSLGATGRFFLSLPLTNALPKIGEDVIVIGSPLGLEQSVSKGIVSAVRQLKPFGHIIQITAPISKGSSGSPVLNLKGEVIGVVTFTVRKGQNINFAIASKYIQKLIRWHKLP